VTFSSCRADDEGVSIGAVKTFTANPWFGANECSRWMIASRLDGRSNWTCRQPPPSVASTLEILTAR